MAGLFGTREGGSALEAAWDRFTASLKAPYALPDVLLSALDLLGELVPAEGYYAYVAPEPGARPYLRVTRTATGNPTVGPNYAGLVTGSTPRAAPLDVDVLAEPHAVRLEGTPTEPFLSMACGPLVVLRAALRPGQRLFPSVRETLSAASRRLHPLLEVAVHLDAVAGDLDQTRVQTATARYAMELVLRVDRLAELVGQATAQVVGDATGYLVSWDADERRSLRVLWQGGPAEELLAALPPQTVWPRVQTGTAMVWSAPRLPGAVARLGYTGFVFAGLGDAPRPAAFALATEKTLEGRSEIAPLLSALVPSLERILRNRALGARLSASYLQSLLLVADLLDAADLHNPQHSREVAALAKATARRMGLPPQEVEVVELAGRLHDLGMIAVNLTLPQKRGQLTDAEREVIRQHPAVGADLLRGLPEEIVPAGVPAAIRHHHERWDGWGYPDRLAQTTIPMPARILAAAEIFMARVSHRSYRRGLPPERALYELRQAAGTQLDPAVVQAVLDVYADQGVFPRAPDD